VATRETHWEGGLTPTCLPLIPSILWHVWFRTCRAQLSPNPTLGEVVCTKRSSEKVCPLVFRPERAHVIQTSVKTQHLCSENRITGNASRSAPSSLIPDPLIRAHPHISTQNAFSCRFYPMHAKNHYSHPNTCITKLSAYIRLYI
jgi:hypothetical protein